MKINESEKTYLPERLIQLFSQKCVSSVLAWLLTYHVNNASHTNNFQQAVVDAWFLKAVIAVRAPEIGSRPPAVQRTHHSDHPARDVWSVRLQKLGTLLPTSEREIA